jgi:hypothetical protein
MTSRDAEMKQKFSDQAEQLHLDLEIAINGRAVEMNACFNDHPQDEYVFM